MPAAKRSRTDDLKWLERAAELYLQACYTKREPVRVGDFANAVGQNRQQVNRRVAALVGLSVSAYLRQKQLDHAQQLLRSTSIPAEQVGLASGFGTAWTFFRCFKDAFGMTPMEFRNVATPRES
jgi:transcriptional regulator GlxA family with amidase domain